MISLVNDGIVIMIIYWRFGFCGGHCHFALPHHHGSGNGFICHIISELHFARYIASSSLCALCDVDVVNRHVQNVSVGMKCGVNLERLNYGQLIIKFIVLLDHRDVATIQNETVSDSDGQRGGVMRILLFIGDQIKY